jgi:hypothetical protein
MFSNETNLSISGNYCNKIMIRGPIKRNLNGRKVLLLFILTNIIYVIMLTVTIPKVMEFSGGMKLLDMMPAGYNSDYVMTLFSNLGDVGRDAYLYRQLPVDMVYPLLFAVSYSLLLGYILNKLGKFENKLFYLCYIPILSGLFDYFENIGIILMLKGYPDISMGLIKLTSIFSVCKSVSTTIFFVMLIVLLIILALIKIKRITSGSSLQ